MTLSTPCAKQLVSACAVLLFVLHGPARPAGAQQDEERETKSVKARDAVTFEIKSYAVEGNTLLAADRVREVLEPYTGPSLTADDVEKARAALETAFHEAGYISVLVNIPVPQTLEGGVVKLEVVESKVARVRVTGNRYFTQETIVKSLPALAAGEILYLPRIQEQLDKINRNPDLKVAPVMMPGRDPGSLEVELKVKDKLPLHGSLELNNRSIHDTTDLRLNASLHYDNLWQRGHSISAQYQTSPQDPNEVQVAAGSYVLPAPWKHDHLLALYGVWSDSDTAFGEGFEVIGKGNIVGARYIMALPPWRPAEPTPSLPAKPFSYAHSLTLGIDYKDLEETVGFQNEPGGDRTPVTYLPLSVAYNASLADAWGATRFSVALDVAFRGLVTRQQEFEDKRYKARGNYLYSVVGVERTQALPYGFALFLRGDGQAATEPLVSSEQYVAGGLESVRGYKENEEVGDHALHAVAQLNGPDLMGLVKLGGKVNLTPFIFYDRASLWLRDPLPGQCGSVNLQGAGAGLQGFVTRFLEYEVAWGVALTGTDQTDYGESRVHFRAKAQF